MTFHEPSSRVVFGGKRLVHSASPPFDQRALSTAGPLAYQAAAIRPRKVFKGRVVRKGSRERDGAPVRGGQ